MKKRRVSGVITVFLSMVLMSLVVCVFLLIEICRLTAMDYITANMLDIGGFSILGDYQKILLEEYDLFFLDASYNTDRVNTAILEDRIGEFVLPVEGELNTFNAIKPESVEITVDNLSKISQGWGKLFRMQAIDSMVNKLGTDFEISYDYSQENEENQELLQRQKDSITDVEDETGTIKEISSFQLIDVTGLVVEDSSEVSSRVIQEDDLFSKRIGFRGKGNTKESLINKGIFDQYIIDKFKCYVDEEKSDEKTVLEYEVEYILCGGLSDRDNLKRVINKLVSLRQGSNMCFLLADIDSNNKCRMAALATVGFTLNPLIIKGTQAAMMLAWSYAEAVCDVRFLLRGEKIPLVKTKSSWNCDLNLVKDILAGAGVTNRNKEGSDYKDYLRILLLMENIDKTTMYAMDLVELNVRRNKGYEEFMIDHCVMGFDLEIKFKAGSLYHRMPFDYEFVKSKRVSYELIGD